MRVQPRLGAAADPVEVLPAGKRSGPVLPGTHSGQDDPGTQSQVFLPAADTQPAAVPLVLCTLWGLGEHPDKNPGNG